MSAPLGTRTKRTLWGVGIGALVAMMFVPVIEYGGYGRTLAERRVGGGYELLIAQSGGADINAPQLVLNVVFAALLGAVCANMSRRAWRWAGGCAALVAVVGGIIALSEVRSAAIARAQSDEEYAAGLQKEAAFAEAKSYLLKAADNWHIAGNAAQEERLRAQAKNLSLLPATPSPTRHDRGDLVSQFAKSHPHRDAVDDFVAKNYSSTPATPPPILHDIFDELARTQLKPDDLKKIILLDVGPKTYPFTDRDGTYSIRGFHGRLRNELSRSVEGIMLRISIYNGARELIEVKNLPLPDTTVAPDSPVAFDRYILFNYIPKGYSYRVEIIDANYVK